MNPNEDEEYLLREVTLQNAKSIFIARQQAEEELVRTKEALELKTAELAHSLGMVRATLESTTDGILATDHDGHVTGFNDKFASMWQLPHEMMELRDHRELVSTTSRLLKDPDQFLQTIDQIYDSSPLETFDLLELADGKIFERFSRIQFVDNRNVGRVWSFRDVTKHRRAEAALQEQAEWLRVTLASIGDAVVTTDTQGRVLSLNGVAEKLTGWTQQEATGQPLLEVFRILDADTRQPADNPATLVLQEDRIVNFANSTILVSRQGTEIPIDDSAAPIRDDNGRTRGVVLVFRDIAERTLAEETNANLFAVLQDSDRRKDEFLAMLSHELRNPLAPIRNAVEILRTPASSTPELQFATDVIDRQIHQMTRLVDDLLDVSRITQGKIELRREQVDLAEILDSAIEVSRPLIEKWGHQLTVSLPDYPILLEADATRLSQVFMNLLNNAAKYMEEGGRISLFVEQELDRVRIAVADNGIGISSDMVPRIFDMFMQVDGSLDRADGGLGLGLTLVKNLVEMHGGSVVVRSDGAGLGSEFIVELPILLTTTMDATQKPVPSPPPSASRRILVVDDSRDSAESLAMILSFLGNETKTAFDGVEALEAAETFRPDVILLDIGLPKMDGHEVARSVREAPWGKNLMLVALTGWGQEEDRRKSQEAGFDRHLVKPVDHDELFTMLNSLPLSE